MTRSATTSASCALHTLIWISDYLIWPPMNLLALITRWTYPVALYSNTNQTHS
jgi:hypothetical protein